MRRLLQVLAVLVLLLVVLVGAAVLYLDRIAAEAVERGGRYALGVDVSVDGVSIGLLAGKLRVRGLEIANPEGYRGPHFARLEEARLDVHPASLRQELVEVPLFSLEGFDLRLERKGRTTNAGALLQNLQRFESGRPAAPEAPAEPAAADGTKFVVRDLVIRDVTAHADLLGGLSKAAPASVTLPEIRVRDVGSETSGGVVAARLFDLVLKAVLRAVIEQQNPIAAALRGEISQGLARLDAVRTEVVGEVETRAREAAERATEAAGEAAGRAAEEAGKAVGDAAGEAAGKAAKEAEGRLRGLLGGEKEEEGSGEGSP